MKVTEKFSEFRECTSEVIEKGSESEKRN